MKSIVRSVLTVAALTAMLGGILGQVSSPVGAAPAAPRPVIASDSVALGDATPGEPLPRWASTRAIAPRISLNPDPEAPLGRTIEVSIADQRLTAWEDGKIVHRFKVSTARPGYRTPRGHFAVKLKSRNYWSRQWQVWMPDALLFHGSYFIHSLPYAHSPAHRIGAGRLGFADSHGCVRVGAVDSKILYQWASVGTPVWVH